MNILKNKLKIVLTIVIFIIISSGISIYATYNYFANDVSYTKLDGTEISVEDALNELYKKEYNVKCLFNRTDNLVTPASTINVTETIKDKGTLIVDMAGVEGNNTLSSKWTHYLKVNNKEVSSLDGSCNGWNGHYYYKVQVDVGDVIKVYSSIAYTANYNGVSIGAYLIY